MRVSRSRRRGRFFYFLLRKNKPCKTLASVRSHIFCDERAFKAVGGALFGRKNGNFSAVKLLYHAFDEIVMRAAERNRTDVVVAFERGVQKRFDSLDTIILSFPAREQAYMKFFCRAVAAVHKISAFPPAHFSAARAIGG